MYFVQTDIFSSSVLIDLWFQHHCTTPCVHLCALCVSGICTLCIILTSLVVISKSLVLNGSPISLWGEAEGGLRVPCCGEEADTGDRDPGVHWVELFMGGQRGYSRRQGYWVISGKDAHPVPQAPSIALIPHPKHILTPGVWARCRQMWRKRKN